MVISSVAIAFASFATRVSSFLLIMIQNKPSVHLGSGMPALWLDSLWDAFPRASSPWNCELLGWESTRFLNRPSKPSLGGWVAFPWIAAQATEWSQIA